MLFKQLCEPIKPWKVSYYAKNSSASIDATRIFLVLSEQPLRSFLSFLPFPDRSCFPNPEAALPLKPRLRLPGLSRPPWPAPPRRERSGREGAGKTQRPNFQAVPAPSGELSQPPPPPSDRGEGEQPQRAIPPRTLLLLFLPPAGPVPALPHPPVTCFPLPARPPVPLPFPPPQPRGPGVLPTRRWGPAGRSADAPAAFPAWSRLAPAAEPSAGPEKRGGAERSSARTSHVSPRGRCQARRERAAVNGRPPSSGAALRDKVASRSCVVRWGLGGESVFCVPGVRVEPGGRCAGRPGRLGG